jgi:hypothetical protein
VTAKMFMSKKHGDNVRAPKPTTRASPGIVAALTRTFVVRFSKGCLCVDQWTLSNAGLRRRRRHAQNQSLMVAEPF